MPNATLLLGSNLGDTISNLADARTHIASRAGAIIRSTIVHQTDPWGYASDNIYANQIIVVHTDLAPLALLDTLLNIETTLGRTRSADARYTDRTIDIDILYYDNITLNHPRLTIPHPRINERQFVLDLLAALD